MVDNPAWINTSGGSANTRDKVRLEKAEAMRCLGILANCRAIGMITVVNNINSVCNALLPDTSSLFNWVYVHCSTFAPKTTELCLQDFGINYASYAAQHRDLEGEGNNDSLSSTKFIISSLTRKHKDILRVLCSYITAEEKKRERMDMAPKTPIIVMPWSLFVNSCIDSLIVKSDPDMRFLMRELIDHNILQQDTDQNGLKVISLKNHPVDVLSALLS